MALLRKTQKRLQEVFMEKYEIYKLNHPCHPFHPLKPLYAPAMKALAPQGQFFDQIPAKTPAPGDIISALFSIKP